MEKLLHAVTTGLTSKRGKRKLKKLGKLKRRKTNITARIKKNKSVVKGAFGTAQRKSSIKRQGTKISNINKRIAKSVGSIVKGPSKRKVKRTAIKSIKKAFGKHVAKIGGQTKRKAVKQYKARKDFNNNPSLKKLI